MHSLLAELQQQFQLWTAGHSSGSGRLQRGAEAVHRERLQHIRVTRVKRNDAVFVCRTHVCECFYDAISALPASATQRAEL